MCHHTITALQIKADTEEVTRSNAEREKEAEKMRKNMRSSLKSYEVPQQPLAMRQTLYCNEDAESSSAYRAYEKVRKRCTKADFESQFFPRHCLSLSADIELFY